MEHNNPQPKSMYLIKSIILWPLDSGVQINDSHRRVVMANIR